MFPGLQPSRRELTPVRLCSVRLSWRQRARPSTTLHEIQICRSRLEYIVCITAGGGPQLEDAGARKLYRRSGWAGQVMVGWAGNVVESQVRERTSMKSYLRFAASFWMSAFLATLSMSRTQTAPATRTKWSSSANAAPEPHRDSGRRLRSIRPFNNLFLF